MRLVCGVGINDADYVVQKKEPIGPVGFGKRKQKLIWICPFYLKWKNMLRRCYAPEAKEQLSYSASVVCDEWHLFSNFKRWMEQQDWQGKELDKDLLVTGNKEYSPDTCVFVTHQVNIFLTERTSMRGEYPIGVHFTKSNGKYRAYCNSVTNGKMIHLGFFSEPEAAHKAWLKYKLEQAHVLAKIEADQRVAEALIARYTNYQTETTSEDVLTC